MMTSSRDKTTEWILSLLNELQSEKFFGKLVIELKDGKTILIRMERTLKPPHNE